MFSFELKLFKYLKKFRFSTFLECRGKRLGIVPYPLQQIWGSKVIFLGSTRVSAVTLTQIPKDQQLTQWFQAYGNYSFISPPITSFFRLGLDADRYNVTLQSSHYKARPLPKVYIT